MHTSEGVAIVIQDARRSMARGGALAVPAPGFFGGRGRTG